MSKRRLNEKAENVERFKRDYLIIGENFVSRDNVAMQDNCKGKNLPVTEETYLQQSKRIIYYKKVKSIMQNVKISVQNQDSNNLSKKHSFATIY